MAKRKATRKAAPKRRRRNPAKRRKTTTRSKARSLGRRMLSGINITRAIKDQFPLQIGMLAAKFAEKKLGGPEASDLNPDSWNWASYAKGAVGALIAGVLCNVVKPGSGQLVFTGGVAQVLNRAIRNEVIQQSTWGIQHLGAEDDMYVDESGTAYIERGGQVMPLNADYRSMGDSLVSPSELGQLEPVGRLGESSPQAENDFAAYAEAFGN